jgi:hypothetical protein
MNEIAFEDEKTKSGIELVKRTKCCFTSNQIYQLAEGFNFEDKMLTFLKGTYDNILDDQSADFYRLLSLFKFESNKSAFNSFIASHRSACSGYETRHVRHHEEVRQHEEGEAREHIDMNSYPTNPPANTNMQMNVNTNMPNTPNISININVPQQPVDNNAIHAEWIEPANNITTKTKHVNIKAKIFCSNMPAVDLMIDNNLIKTDEMTIRSAENYGYIYENWVKLHPGENHLVLRLINPATQQYIYSADMVVYYDKD